MCRIKTGAQITELSDVQNLVTACILRSQQPCTIADLSQKVLHSCEGSNLSISDNQVIELVRDTTMALLRSKYISVNAGHYFAKPVYPDMLSYRGVVR